MFNLQKELTNVQMPSFSRGKLSPINDKDLQILYKDRNI